MNNYLWGMLGTFCLTVVSVLDVKPAIAFSSNDAGNSPETALNIGQLDTTPVPQSFTDFVGVADQDDYYRFELQSASQVELHLDGLSQGANLILADSLGTVIQRSINRGKTPEEIITALEPGTYYVLVRSSVENNTNYVLTLAAEFIPRDVVVSNPNQPMRDTEFDEVGDHVTWMDDQANLWVAPVDPQTGDFLLQQETFVDSGLAPFLEQGIRNGPEWAYSRYGSQIVYTKLINGNWYLGRAKWTGDVWETDVLPNSANSELPFGSLNPEDETPLIKYSIGSPTTGPRLATAWREVEGSNIGSLITPGYPTSGGRWVQGERSLILSIKVQGVFQVAKFIVDTGTWTQLTFDATNKSSAFMWRAPEFNNELVFMALEGDPEDPLAGKSVGIYRLINNQWTKVKTLQPPSKYNSVDSPEPFVYNGKSYISMLTVKGPQGVPKRYEGAQVWIAGIEPEFVFYRRLNSNVGNPINDPEPFTLQGGAFVYYTDATQNKAIIHRLDTGLGLPNPSNLD
jgi:hypothetical protein